MISTHYTKSTVTEMASYVSILNDIERRHCLIIDKTGGKRKTAIKCCEKGSDAINLLLGI